MNETWYWKLGFSNNPFTIKPGAITNEIIAYNVQPIIERIKKGEPQFIEAPFGRGKTTILKGIIAKFGGKKKLVYANCIRQECLDVKNLLKNATIKGKIFGNIPREMILLVDEAQNLLKEDALEINEFIKKGNIKAVTFFGTEYTKGVLPAEVEASLNGNVIHLPYLTPEQAVELVRQRIGNLKLLPDYVIRELYARSDGNPRKLLQNCEDACRKGVELSLSELTVTDVATLLKTPSEKKPKARKQKTPDTKPKEATKLATEKKKPAIKQLLKKTAQKKQPMREQRQTREPRINYTGYNLKNIRTYEEEFGLKTKREEELP